MTIKNSFTCPFSGKEWSAKERDASYKETKMAITNGTIPKQSKCNRCGKTTGRIDYHNHSYDHPLLYLEEICQGCHTSMHRRFNSKGPSDSDRQFWEAIMKG